MEISTDSSDVTVSTGNNKNEVLLDNDGYWRSDGSISNSPHWLQVFFFVQTDLQTEISIDKRAG